VPGVLIMIGASLGDTVLYVLVGRLHVILMRHVFHLELPNSAGCAATSFHSFFIFVTLLV
jgi:hypothetical protein